jgi:hypothetical protein
MIKKRPLTFSKLKKLSSYGLFYILTSEALHQVEGTKKLKTMSFHQYSWNSEVETTWISLNGWPYKMSTVY